MTLQHRTISTKNIIALILLLLINAIFSLKYLDRFTPYAPFFTIVIVVLQAVAYFVSLRFPISARWYNILFYLLLLGIVACVLVSHRYIPLESLQVDRHSVIDGFLTELFAGRYPYFATSHMGNYPGPMPMYFVIAWPFHALGELSLLSALGYIMFTFTSKRQSFKLFVLLYLGTSLFMVWEILVRSNIFTYSVLILWAMIAFWRVQALGRIAWIALALICGLLLSTRSVYALVYVVFFVSALVHKSMLIKEWAAFVAIAFLAFAATFLPFATWFPNQFWIKNPFLVQHSLMANQSLLIIIVLLSLIAALAVRDQRDAFLYSGLVLFICIMLYAVELCIRYGFQSAYWDSMIDISYFLFCVPFLLHAMGISKRSSE